MPQQKLQQIEIYIDFELWVEIYRELDIYHTHYSCTQHL